MICFYHNDLDGCCAAAILFLENRLARYEPVDYKDPFPFHILDKNAEVWIVDFSLQNPGDWSKLFDITPNVIWIDHHVTAIERTKDTLASLLLGIRNDGQESGAELVWQYLYPGRQSPSAVHLVSLWDTWKHNESAAVLEFVAGMKAEECKPQSKLWECLFDQPDIWLPKVQAEGRIILRYENQQNQEYIKSFSFVTALPDCPWRVLSCNKGMTNSKLFNSRKDWDIAAPFVFDGSKYTVSLYSKRDDIRVCDIAKTYGGGGHPKAAGFQCTKLPFITPGLTVAARE